MTSATQTPAATIGIEWERRKVARETIATDPEFKTRHGRPDAIHVKTLAASIKRGGALTLIILWKQEGRNSFVLLDGEHRLAAYKVAGWKGDIPARVVTCSRRDALLIAAGANTRDVKPLTQNERADIAWKLVREPGAKFTKGEIARAAGVAERTVTTMRARLRTLKETGREPEGRWWQDRTDNEDDGQRREMSDAERRATIKALAEKLRKAADNAAFRDEQLFAEALDEAFGMRLRAAIDYLYADEVDEWTGFHVSNLDHESDEDEGDDDPAF